VERATGTDARQRPTNARTRGARAGEAGREDGAAVGKAVRDCRPLTTVLVVRSRGRCTSPKNVRLRPIQKIECALGRYAVFSKKGPDPLVYE
jgi:hypothetical protein